MTSSWMVVAGALFATMGVFAKLLAGQFTGSELSLYRSFIAVVAVGALMWWTRQSLATPFWKGHFWRGLTGTISLIAYFYSMTQLPLATAVALNYTSPMWLALLSTILLGEPFRARLVLAVVLGFIGAALLLQPTFSAANAYAGWIGLASGFFAACAYVNVKKLGDAGEPATRVVFYFAVVGTVGSALTQGVIEHEFHPVNAGNIGLLLGLGLAAAFAQLAMTRAYHLGNTLVVGAFAYSTVIFASLAGVFIFDERLPPVAWLGMAIIIASGLLAKTGSKRVDDKLPPLPAEED